MKDKDILFLPMAHLSEEKFYIECKKAIDSLSNNGYYIFGEQIYFESKFGINTSANQDSIFARKVRKMLGNLQHDQDTIIRRIMVKYNLVKQPYSLYCIDELSTNSCKIVDFSVRKLVESYEQVKGEIVLSECDKNTPLSQDYKCKEKPQKSDRKFFMNDIVVDKRDQYISKEVKQSKHKKILLIYGEAHFKGIKKLLEDTK